MRITIELPDHLRAEVMALSARRGYRGYGRIIVEAVEHYLADIEAKKNDLDKVLALSGTWTAREADEARSKVQEVRANYRKMTK